MVDLGGHAWAVREAGSYWEFWTCRPACRQRRLKRGDFSALADPAYLQLYFAWWNRLKQKHARHQSYTCCPPLIRISAPYIGRCVGAQHIDDLGDFIGAQPMQRDLCDDPLGSGGKDRCVDFTRHDRIDANAERPAVARHFAGQGGEHGL